MVTPNMGSPPNGQIRKSLEYKVEVDRSGDFTFILKGNIKKICTKIFEMITSIRFSILTKWFLENILI